MLHVERMPLTRVPPERRAAWEALARRALEPNPFAEPALAVAAGRHLAGGARAELVAVVDETGTLHAGLPVRAGWRTPLPSTGSWIHPYAFCGAPLVGPERPDEAVQALLGGIDTRSRLGCTAFEWIGDDGPVAALIRRAAADAGRPIVAWEHFRRPALRPDRPPGPALSGHRRRRVARDRRGLAAELGAAPDLVDRAGDPAAVERFLALEAAGWKGRAGTALLDRPGDAAFFRSACAEGAATGALQLWSLEAGVTVVAMLCSLGRSPASFTFKVAHDTRFEPWAPGRVLLCELVEATAAAGGLLDSCAASEGGWLATILPDRLEITTLVVAPPGRPGRLLARALGRVRDRRRGEAAPSRPLSSALEVV